jgi:hypothetical protein
VRVIVFVPVVKMFVIGDVEIDDVLVLADLQAENERGTATRATRHINAIAIRISQRGPLY